MIEIQSKPLTQANFARFGDVLECVGDPDKIINQGKCARFHDRAALDFGAGGRAGVSLFKAEPRSLPYVVNLVERHPEGSQAFVPMSFDPFLVITAEGHGPVPGTLHAFLTKPGQAINFHKGTWHGVLTPLFAPGLFAVIDRIGNTQNLEEYLLDPQYIVVS